MADQNGNMADSISPARVAYDLMARIAQAEHVGKTITNPRQYYLALYRECADAVQQAGQPQGFDVRFVSAEDAAL